MAHPKSRICRLSYPYIQSVAQVGRADLPGLIPFTCAFHHLINEIAVLLCCVHALRDRPPLGGFGNGVSQARNLPEHETCPPLHFTLQRGTK